MTASGRELREEKLIDWELDTSEELKKDLSKEPELPKSTTLDKLAALTPAAPKSVSPIHAALKQWLESQGTPLEEALYKIYADLVYDHVFEESEEEVLTCPDCKEQFDSEWVWIKHLKKNCSIVCRVCDEHFERVSDLQDHRHKSQSHRQILEALTKGSNPF